MTALHHVATATSMGNARVNKIVAHSAATGSLAARSWWKLEPSKRVCVGVHVRVFVSVCAVRKPLNVVGQCQRG